MHSHNYISIARAAAAAACLIPRSLSTPVIGSSQATLQAPLEYLTEEDTPPRQLHGRFLHITDLHPDPFYRVHSSTEEEDACHRGTGVAGVYGAETTDCDTPYALINATFKWIDENVKNTVDFVVWTGDSARHDNDEELPRTQDEVLNANIWIANKFLEVFSHPKDPDSLAIPIISTFGNNDILPHNILLSGPNRWLKQYTSIWNRFIPEEQRHGFERGGWYYVEVIPNKLAVFSLNTLYFFNHNAAVDGCALRSEPGFEHMEWLRIQLQFMRERGMKAILMGHVPPARTESKTLWDETCWQKYTLWLRQYRDVVISSLYGHMNIDHFTLQDHEDIDLSLTSGETPEDVKTRGKMDEEFTITSANDYLEELREDWSDLPNPSIAFEDLATDSENRSGALKKKKKKKKKQKKPKETKKEKALKKIGGPWGERYQVTMISPSLVPNFFPTLRLVEYNISGLDRAATWAKAQSEEVRHTVGSREEKADYDEPELLDGSVWREFDAETATKKKKKKKPKKPKNPDFVIPSPPSKTSPPGPGYSPQTLTLTGYTQYFANITYINNDDLVFLDAGRDDDEIEADKWKGGKHKGKHPKNKSPPKAFRYEIEYDTFNDPIYKLKDLTVKSYLQLAHRIGQYKPEKGDEAVALQTEDSTAHDMVKNDEDVDSSNKKHRKKDKKHNKKKGKHHRQHKKNKVWLTFVSRAFVQALDDVAEAQSVFPAVNGTGGNYDPHDFELWKEVR